MNVLVTGAMGFVGSHWCEHLLQRGERVWGIDLSAQYPHLQDYRNFTFVRDTIKDYNLLQKLVNRADMVYHFAGIAEPEQYVTAPRKVIDITANVGMRLIEMCRFSDKLLFLTSTSEVYGKNAQIPFSEDDDRILGSTRTKRWCYSTSKALLEHYLEACAFEKELDFITVRLFNIYGPRLHGRVVSRFIRNALRGEPLTVHGDGQQSRCFTYIDDMIQAFQALVDTPECRNEVFNVGYPVEYSIKEMAEIIIDETGGKSGIEYTPHREAFGLSYEDIPRRVPNISKIKRFTSWEPKISLREGIRRMIAAENAGKPDIWQSRLITTTDGSASMKATSPR